MEEILVHVSGVVQGVGFRFLINQYALKHNIKGFVRNLSDGRVEICAQGTDKEIQEFFDEIYQNPGRALIKRFDEKKRKCNKIHSTFTVY